MPGAEGRGCDLTAIERMFDSVIDVEPAAALHQDVDTVVTGSVDRAEDRGGSDGGLPILVFAYPASEGAVVHVEHATLYRVRILDVGA